MRQRPAFTTLRAMSTPDRQTFIADAERVFVGCFGARPTQASHAPGRVNLIGEHTDYSGGLVLPMAIDAGCAALGRLGTEPGGRVRIWSVNQQEMVTLEANALGPGSGWHGKGWTSYAAGVLAVLRDRVGVDLPSMNVVVASDVPLGAGLSSSAAFEVSLCALTCALAGVSMGHPEMASVARAAERGYAGMPCGIMDQLVSACAVEGHALLIDCATENTTPISLAQLGEVAVLVIDSTVKHALVSGEYKRRADGCEEAAKILGVKWLRDATPELVAARATALGDELHRYARHVVGENARVESFVRAVAQGDTDEAGRCMAASHASLRDDFRVSCPELDAIADACAVVPGVIGCRMTGGGFGGSSVALVRPEAIDACRAAADRALSDQFQRKPRSHVVRASAGVQSWFV